MNIDTIGRLVAVDTETTGLDVPPGQAWEFATVELTARSIAIERVWRIQPTVAAVEAMHPIAAEKNRYHERTADPDWVWDSPDRALAEMHEVLDGATIVGLVPWFDTQAITATFHRFGVSLPTWDHHLRDVEGIAYGWLHGYAAATGAKVHPVADEVRYRSDELSRACGVLPPDRNERHTALADARWAARWYQRITT